MVGLGLCIVMAASALRLSNARRRFGRRHHGIEQWKAVTDFSRRANDQLDLSPITTARYRVPLELADVIMGPRQSAEQVVSRPRKLMWNPGISFWGGDEIIRVPC